MDFELQKLRREYAVSPTERLKYKIAHVELRCQPPLPDHVVAVFGYVSALSFSTTSSTFIVIPGSQVHLSEGGLHHVTARVQLSSTSCALEVGIVHVSKYGIRQQQNAYTPYGIDGATLFQTGIFNAGPNSKFQLEIRACRPASIISSTGEYLGDQLTAYIEGYELFGMRLREEREEK